METRIIFDEGIFSEEASIAALKGLNEFILILIDSRERIGKFKKNSLKNLEMLCNVLK